MSRDRRTLLPEAQRLEGRQLLTSTSAKSPFRVGFLTPSILTSQQSASATVTISRGWAGRVVGVAGLPDESAFKVRLTTDPSPSVGVNLPAVDQTIAFAAHEDSKTVTIPINKGAANPGEVDVKLRLTFVGPSLRIPLAPTTVLRIRTSSDVIPPIVVARKWTARSISMTFSEPMSPAGVQDIKNYDVQSLTHQDTTLAKIIGFSGNLFGKGRFKSDTKSRNVPLIAASYDPATRTVTLIPARPLNPLATTTVSLTSRGAGAKSSQQPLPRTTVTDLAGNPVGGYGGSGLLMTIPKGQRASG